jgi:hypothetical protein
MTIRMLLENKQKTITLKMVLCTKMFVLYKIRFQSFNNSTLKGGETMKATPYKWVNIMFNNVATIDQTEEQESAIEQIPSFNNVATIDQTEEQESAIEQIPSDNITQIVQLVEKLIDLTVDDSDRAEKITQILLNQVESL